MPSLRRSSGFAPTSGSPRSNGGKHNSTGSRTTWPNSARADSTRRRQPGAAPPSVLHPGTDPGEARIRVPVAGRAQLSTGSTRPEPAARMTRRCSRRDRTTPSAAPGRPCRRRRKPAGSAPRGRPSRRNDRQGGAQPQGSPSRGRSVPAAPATMDGQPCANTSDRPHALTLAESHSLHRG